MAVATVTKFNTFVEDLWKGVHDFSSDTFKLALSDRAPLATHSKLSNITQIAATGSYGAGGYTLDNTTLTRSNGTLSITFDDALTAATGGSIGPFRYYVLYNDTVANKPLILWLDRGISETLLDGEDITIDFPPSAFITAT